MHDPQVGAVYLGQERTRFRVWAPMAPQVQVHITAPKDRVEALKPRDARGYHEATVPDIGPGALYMYRLEQDLERPDPASRSQPLGVHGPSEVIDPAFDWRDQAWSGLPLPHYVLYELHVGMFTPEGTFAAIIPHLDRLRDLGITAVELMPVAQFPGCRNWGYDGVYPYAVQDSYGGAAGLKGLVDACHQRGLAVVLDVVYNHLGPEGNYLADFGPYFTERYRTPWGPALNFDGPHSDEVRAYFIQNALAWVTSFHIDALRLDAVHAIADTSAVTFLEELAAAVHECAERLQRRVHVIPESAANDPRLIRPRDLGGYGMDAQWSDDFHHALRTSLTPEHSGYYGDYHGLPDLARAWEQGFVQAGRYSPHRRRRYGASSRDIPAQRFVVFSQNHDQVGNRMLAERLTRLASFEAVKMAAGSTLLSPFLPLIFMGEEYGETAPFLYFISHGDQGLVEAVRKGRRQEFAAFGWPSQQSALNKLSEPPDPQHEATFLASKLRHDLRDSETGRALQGFYTELLRLRREWPCLSHLSKDSMTVTLLEAEKTLIVKRWHDDDAALLLFHFNASPGKPTIPSSLLSPFCSPQPSESLSDGMMVAGGFNPWLLRFHSDEKRWLGKGRVDRERLDSRNAALELPPLAFAVFRRE